MEKMIFRVQPSEYVDQIVDGHEMTKMPYPFYVDESGEVQHQDLWQGDPSRVIGFQDDLARHEIDLWWSDAVKDPALMIGRYLVTVDSKGNMGVHQTAISDAHPIQERDRG
jgi:hypothetical protein